MKRPYTKAQKEHVEPVHVPDGEYLSLTDWGRTQGIKRITAYQRFKKGGVRGIRIGQTVLIRVNNSSK